jgi:hypothetical protein
VEHVRLELIDAAGIPVNRGTTVRPTFDTVHEIAVEYKSEPGMRRLLEIAVRYLRLCWMRGRILGTIGSPKYARSRLDGRS